jgi:hemoglobin
VDLARLGGEDGVRRWVERFYDLVSTHPVLVPIFPKDLSASRQKQWEFFVEFFGGPPLYTTAHGNAFLRYRHRKVKIGQPERDAWMAMLLQSLRDVSQDETLVRDVEARVAPVADHMMNHHPEKKDAVFFN